MARLTFRFFVRVLNGPAESFVSSRLAPGVNGSVTINVNFKEIEVYPIEEHVLTELVEAGLSEQVIPYFQVFGNQPMRLHSFATRRNLAA